MDRVPPSGQILAQLGETESVLDQEGEDFPVAEFAFCPPGFSLGPDPGEAENCFQICAQESEPKFYLRSKALHLSRFSFSGESCEEPGGEAEGIEERIEEEEPEGEVDDSEPDAIAFDEADAGGIPFAERCAAMVVDDGGGSVTRTPACASGAEAEFGVVGIGKEIFVEAADLVEHGFAIEGGTAVGPENFAFGVVLTGVCFAAPAAAILPIPINAVTDLVDDTWAGGDENFRGNHADGGIAFDFREEGIEPLRFGYGVVVEEGDVGCGGDGDTSVIACAKAEIAAELQ